MACAWRARRLGYSARVRRPARSDPVPSVELASCIVRFFVPGRLDYARVDSAPGSHEDALPLAVWAWQVADQRDPDGAVVDVEVGLATAAQQGEEPALSAALDLAADVLADGAAQVGVVGERLAAAARRALHSQNLRWPVDIVDELAEQLAAYRVRSTGYEPGALATLLAELVARIRCAAGGAALRVSVLGTEESASTPLRLSRLTGLGARVRGTAEQRRLEVYLADGRSGAVLVVRRTVAGGADGEPSGLQRLARTTVARCRVETIAAAEVVTESAVRAANRTVTFASGRASQTTVIPSGGAWQGLPATLLLRDLDAAAEELAARPPAVVRPRVGAYDLRVVAVVDVTQLGWAPGGQELSARVTSDRGELLLRRAHTLAAPGAVGALADVLAGGQGPVRYVAGHLSRRAGRLLLEPTAVAVPGRVVVPDLVAPTASALAPVVATAAGDALEAVVLAGLRVTAEVAHHGWRHLPPSWAERSRRAGDALRGAGLRAAGDAVAGLPGGLAGGQPRDVLDRWADVHLRLLVTAEQV